MPFENILQPEIINIEEGLRLRKFDWDIERMIKGSKSLGLKRSRERKFSNGI